MPNPAKQLERHTWAAGYADGYIDGLEEAWEYPAKSRPETRLLMNRPRWRQSAVSLRRSRDGVPPNRSTANSCGGATTHRKQKTPGTRETP